MDNNTTIKQKFHTQFEKKMSENISSSSASLLNQIVNNKAFQESVANNIEDNAIDSLMNAVSPKLEKVARNINSEEGIDSFDAESNIDSSEGERVMKNEESMPSVENDSSSNRNDVKQDIAKNKKSTRGDIAKQKSEIQSEVGEERAIQKQMLEKAKLRNEREKSAIAQSVKNSENRDLSHGTDRKYKNADTENKSTSSNYHNYNPQDVDNKAVKNNIEDTTGSSERRMKTGAVGIAKSLDNVRGRKMGGSLARQNDNKRILNRKRIASGKQQNWKDGGIVRQKKDSESNKSLKPRLSNFGKIKRELDDKKKNTSGKKKKIPALKKTFENASKAMARVSAEAQTYTAFVLQKAWSVLEIFPVGTILGALYIFFHGAMKYMFPYKMVNDLFCRYGEEWLQGKAGAAGKAAGKGGTLQKAKGKGIGSKMKENAAAKGVEAAKSAVEFLEKALVVTIAGIIAAIVLTALVLIAFLLGLSTWEGIQLWVEINT